MRGFRQMAAMSSIEIVHPHARTQAEARQAIDQAAAKLRERFGVESHWQGDELQFARPGVEGRIAVLPGQVKVQAQLGFLFAAFQGLVEDEIRRVLADKLG
jgi:putative polyhydroxyalkanoate system protein